MLSPNLIHQQVQTLTADLIGMSLCTDQRFPVMHQYFKDLVEITFGKESNLSIVLKSRPYRELYCELERNRSYNLKMLDGAILQMMYLFKNRKIESHRLAFFPSPFLEEFQNNPEIYEKDEFYADIIKKNIVPFPLRFDFDCSEAVPKVIEHPKSHLTLGQYQNCRIPVSAPLTPYYFLSFVLRNFYNTAYKKFSNKITVFHEAFKETIEIKETSIISVQIPRLDRAC